MAKHEDEDDTRTLLTGAPQQGLSGHEQQVLQLDQLTSQQYTSVSIQSSSKDPQSMSASASYEQQSSQTSSRAERMRTVEMSAMSVFSHVPFLRETKLL